MLAIQQCIRQLSTTFSFSVSHYRPFGTPTLYCLMEFKSQNGAERKKSECMDFMGKIIHQIRSEKYIKTMRKKEMKWLF